MMRIFFISSLNTLFLCLAFSLKAVEAPAGQGESYGLMSVEAYRAFEDDDSSDEEGVAALGAAGPTLEGLQGAVDFLARGIFTYAAELKKSSQGVAFFHRFAELLAGWNVYREFPPDIIVFALRPLFVDFFELMLNDPLVLEGKECFDIIPSTLSNEALNLMLSAWSLVEQRAGGHLKRSVGRLYLHIPEGPDGRFFSILEAFFLDPTPPQAPQALGPGRVQITPGRLRRAPKILILPGLLPSPEAAFFAQELLENNASLSHVCLHGGVFRRS